MLRLTVPILLLLIMVDVGESYRHKKQVPGFRRFFWRGRSHSRGNSGCTNLCDPSPCLNGGTCNPTKGSFTCTCPPGFTENTCNVNLCDPSPCLNGGTCNPTKGSFTCTCPNGFTGDTCNVNLCDPSPCLNGGTCNPTKGSFTCTCPNGFTGNTCNVNLCAINCSNETASCVPFLAPGGYACSCVERISESIVCNARSIITPVKFYDSNLDVTTTIPGVPGKNLTISFIDDFGIEKGSNTCVFDYVKIEGILYCGLEAPADITLPTGAGTQVRFVSDYSFELAGYTLTYQYIDAVPVTHPCKNGGTPIANETCNCMPGFQGTNCEFPPLLTSGGEYAGNQSTAFTLPGFPEKELVLTFDDDFSIETTDGNCNDTLRTNCMEDYVEIEGIRYCGGVAPGPITIPTGNGTTVRFVSNDDDEQCISGFTLTYVYRDP